MSSTFSRILLSLTSLFALRTQMKNLGNKVLSSYILLYVNQLHEVLSFSVLQCEPVSGSVEEALMQCQVLPDADDDEDNYMDNNEQEQDNNEQEQDNNEQEQDNNEQEQDNNEQEQEHDNNEQEQDNNEQEQDNNEQENNEPEQENIDQDPDNNKHK